MREETKTCQNCRASFTIDASDFAFYEKIKVPPPTWCPECRMVRRWLFRNERIFYKRLCDLCKKDTISIYDSAASFPVYCQTCWWSDKWSPLDYGREYDFNRPFFEQNKELRLKVPRVAIINKGSINSPYTHISANNKNCYMLVETSNNEDCYFGYWLEEHCKDIFDSAFLSKVEISYETLFAENSFKLFFSQYCQNCVDGFFLFDCVNSSNCFGCVNLRNKQYHIFNTAHIKEKYEAEIRRFDLGSYNNLRKFQKEFRDFSLKFPRRFAYMIKSQNSSGNYITNSKNCTQSFFIDDAEEIKFSVHAFSQVRDLMDIDTVGIGGELCYESINTALGVSRMIGCMRCWTGRDSLYCDNCDDSNSNFGCIGLRYKQYCILNKQYTKEEYEALVPKIIQHMNDMPYVDSKGRVYKYGEFFPPELSPFAYNETIAQEYFPLNKEEAEERGYHWKEPETKQYNITIKTEDLPDHIKDVPDSITNEVIQCSHTSINGGSTSVNCNEQCTTAFKIIPQELEFYRKMNLPLPRLCPNCRHYQRIKQRNPLKLWRRACQCAGEKSENGVYANKATHPSHTKDAHCPNEFETSYAPERKEIVYCEQCYQQEVV